MKNFNVQCSSYTFMVNGKNIQLGNMYMKNYNRSFSFYSFNRNKTYIVDVVAMQLYQVLCFCLCCIIVWDSVYYIFFFVEQKWLIFWEIFFTVCSSIHSFSVSILCMFHVLNVFLLLLLILFLLRCYYYSPLIWTLSLEVIIFDFFFCSFCFQWTISHRNFFFYSFVHSLNMR